MTAKEAYKLLQPRLTNKKVVKCTEYDSVFVFQVAPEGFTKDPNKLADCNRSVNKTTGQVKVFQPFDIPLAEYRRGIIIPDYE